MEAMRVLRASLLLGMGAAIGILLDAAHVLSFGQVGGAVLWTVCMLWCVRTLLHLMRL